VVDGAFTLAAVMEVVQSMMRGLGTEAFLLC
jgi:hypothetical protein